LKPLITDVAKASLTHKTFSSEQVRTLEPALAKAVGCSMFALMERAGKSAFEVMQCHWPDATKILVLTGSGNNAGDGFILLSKQVLLAFRLIYAVRLVTKYWAVTRRLLSNSGAT
jgi:NAD(P)H-hydrate repair Nnr-like enzyme with NAD(P)H-hydrate epimerase domain